MNIWASYSTPITLMKRFESRTAPDWGEKWLWKTFSGELAKVFSDLNDVYSTVKMLWSM